jgi:hypothetical protein
LVARFLGVEEVAGSNPAGPTRLCFRVEMVPGNSYLHFGRVHVLGYGVPNQSTSPETHMLYTIVVVLVILWLLGLVGHIGGGLIHLLLVVAVILFIVSLISGRRGL